MARMTVLWRLRLAGLMIAASQPQGQGTIGARVAQGEPALRYTA